MGNAATPQQVRVKVSAHNPSGSTTLKVEVPSISRTSIDLLPAIRRIDDALVASAEQASEAAGRPVTCREGCGACCRQLVPITEPEAQALAALVKSFPGDHRRRIETRFEAAETRLADAGLLDAVRDAKNLARDPRRKLGAEYFRLGIACPFLENERCSIYSERPLICREFLVTSAAEECQSFGKVERIPVNGRLHTRLSRGGSGETRWVPLVMALSWAGANPIGEGLAHNQQPGPRALGDVLGVRARMG